MKYIYTFDHTHKINGASNILNNILKYSKKNKNIKTINFIFSPEKISTNKKKLKSSYNSSFLISLLKELFIYTFPNLKKILNELRKTSNSNINILIWNTLTRLWYLPLLNFFLFRRQIKFYAYCHEAPIFFQKRRLFKFIYYFYFKFIDKVIVLNKDQANYLSKFGCPENKFIKINNAVYVNNNKSKSERDTKNFNKEILFLSSNLSYRKGYDCLIRYICNLNNNNLKFSIYGEHTIETDKIEKKYLRSNSKVFINKLGLTNLADIEINNYIAYISPSRSEAQPLVPIEMAFYKIPLILSDIKSHKEIFKNNSVIFFNSEDINSIKKSINKFLLLNEKEKKMMVERAFKLVNKKFSSKAFEEKIKNEFFIID